MWHGGQEGCTESQGRAGEPIDSPETFIVNILCCLADLLLLVFKLRLLQKIWENVHHMWCVGDYHIDYSLLAQTKESYKNIFTFWFSCFSLKSTATLSQHNLLHHCFAQHSLSCKNNFIFYTDCWANSYHKDPLKNGSYR